MTDRDGMTTVGARVRPSRMLVIAAAWGSCFLLLEWGIRGATVLWFVTWRALLAGVALLAVGALSRRRNADSSPPLTAGTWGLIGVLAVMNVTLAFAAMAQSTLSLTTGIAAMLANAQPLLVILPAWALFGEKPRPVEVTGVALGFGGLIVIALPSGGGHGAGLALLAAVGVTVGALLARRLADVDVLMLGAWQYLLGGLMLALMAAVIEGPPTMGMPASSVAALVTLALAGTAVPYVLWFTELRRASITAVTSWTMLVPVIGAALGVVVLRESPSGAEIIGAAAVLVALAVVAYPGGFVVPKHR